MPPLRLKCLKGRRFGGENQEFSFVTIKLDMIETSRVDMERGLRTVLGALSGGILQGHPRLSGWDLRLWRGQRISQELSLVSSLERKLTSATVSVALLWLYSSIRPLPLP